MVLRRRLARSAWCRARSSGYLAGETIWPRDAGRDSTLPVKFEAIDAPNAHVAAILDVTAELGTTLAATSWDGPLGAWKQTNSKMAAANTFRIYQRSAASETDLEPVPPAGACTPHTTSCKHAGGEVRERLNRAVSKTDSAQSGSS